MAAIALTVIAGTVAGFVMTSRLNRSPATAAAAVSPAPIIDRTAPDWFSALPFNCLGSTGLGFGSPTTIALVDGVVAESHAGYDRVIIQFAAGGPAQAQLTTQPNSTFAQVPGRNTITLKGQDGVLVILPGTDAHTRYSGPGDLKTSGPVVLEMRKVEDSGGTVEWGIGLARVPCYRMAFLESPVRLAIDFQSALAA